VHHFKVASLTALSHLSKLLVNFFIIKQIALTQGPEGLGLLGNFMTLVSIAGCLAGGGITSGVIKYIAEYSDTRLKQISFAGSALIYTTVSTLAILLLGLLFIQPITHYIFLSNTYGIYICFFLFAQILVAFNNLSYGLLNGFKKNYLYALLTIIGNLIALGVAWYSIKFHGQGGAIIAILAPVVCPFLPICVYAVSKSFRPKIQFSSLRNDSLLLSKFSLMLLFSTICFPLVEMHVRNTIILQLGIEAAGFWQAITKLSTAYLSFYSLFLTFYFVPIISSESTSSQILRETRKMVVFIIGLFAIMFALFVCLETPIIKLVLTEKFLVIHRLFLLQMIGDFFRVIGWIVGFIVVAKAVTPLYILGEIVQGGLFILLSTIELHYTPNLYGIEYAYIASCFLYCLMSFSAFFYCFRNKSTHLAAG
jgi:O-antigen/teichoic acid export membrane protein